MIVSNQRSLINVNSIFWTVLYDKVRWKRWQHDIVWKSSAFCLLCVWSMCGCLLAIYHEIEISVCSRGVKEYHFKFLQNSSEHFCVRCSLQCKLFIYFLFAKKSLKYLAFLFAQWFLSFSVFFSNALGQTLNEQHTVNLSVISQLYGQYVLVFSISGVNQVFGEITKTRAFGEIKKNLLSVFQNLPPYLMTLEVPLKGKCLFQVNAFPITIMFGMCAIFLVMASVLQHRFMVAAEKHKSGKAQYVSCTRQAYRRQHIAVLLHSFILINGFWPFSSVLFSSNRIHCKRHRFRSWSAEHLEKRNGFIYRRGWFGFIYSRQVYRHITMLTEMFSGYEAPYIFFCQFLYKHWRPFVGANVFFQNHYS